MTSAGLLFAFAAWLDYWTRSTQTLIVRRSRHHLNSSVWKITAGHNEAVLSIYSRESVEAAESVTALTPPTLPYW